MKKSYLGALLWCLNNDTTPLIVLKRGESIDIYSSTMDFKKSVDSPFEPYYYLVLSPSQFLIFDSANRIAFVDVEQKTPIEIEPPKGTSVYKSLAQSAIHKTEDGFLFLPINTSVRKTSYSFVMGEDKFKRVNIKLPDYCFAFCDGEDGAFFFIDEDSGDFKACSFETAYKNRNFIAELVLNKNAISETICSRDPFRFASCVAHVSVKNKQLILVLGDETYLSPFHDHKLGTEHYTSSCIRESVVVPESGKIVLLRDGNYKKVLKLKYRPYIKYYKACPGSVLFLKNGKGFDAYSTADLTLLATLPIDSGPKTIFLPDVGVLYEMSGRVYVTDPSPLSFALEKQKMG